MSTLRASSYTIYVPLESSEAVLLVHGYTGACDLVSAAVAAYVHSLAPAPPQPLYGAWRRDAPPSPAARPSAATIERLSRRGFLTAKSVAEEENWFVRYVRASHQRELTRAPDYAIVPTYACNLQCERCRPGEPDEAPAIMAEETLAAVIRAVKALDADATPPAASPRTLWLIGGEPLLARCRPIVERIVAEFGRLPGFEIGALTNATELDAYADLLGPGMIASLNVALSASPEDHQRRLRGAVSSGGHDEVIANVKLAQRRGVRVRVCAGEQALNEAGVSIAPASGTRLTALARDLLSGKGDRSRERTAFCAASATMYVFDPFGDVYACWDRIGNPAVRTGLVLGSGRVVLTGFHRLWRERTVVSNRVCKSCAFALYCGGGCAAAAENRSGTIFADHCDAFAERFRRAVTGELTRLTGAG